MQAIAFEPTEEFTSESIDAYLAQHENKGLLRFLTCGNVDDGKSTLLGRLLYDSQMLFDDQLAALEKDSKLHGTQQGELDFALLVDGLSAEREQGITIDVAYRFFSTDKRKFIVADCPGHEQYTRNMATGASTADLAIVLVDARKGLQTQTRRHTWICSLLGIKNIVLAVNKMDLVSFDQATFDAIESDYRALAQSLGIEHIQAIPLSALRGDNISQLSEQTPWYQGPSLLNHLETVELLQKEQQLAFRLPVQWVCRPDSSFRGYAGQVAAGSINVGDEVIVLPSGTRSSVARIVTADGDLQQAFAGQAINLVLNDERDISRGDVIVSAQNPAPVADQFHVNVLWLDESTLQLNQPYRIKIGAQTSNAKITRIVHKIDINNQEKLSAERLQLNEAALCQLSLEAPIAFEAYQQNHQLGAFILIDRQSNATVAAGTIANAVNSSDNVRWQDTKVDAQKRAELKGQKPACLWFTGLSGAGKSTIADKVESRLHALGYHTYLLDGDNLRHGLNADLGFSAEDRQENIRRVAATAQLMADAGLIVLVSTISPYKADRAAARALFADNQFHEIHVDTPISLCEERDIKGLYAKARAGEIKDFTGIDAPYEAPEQPELHLQGERNNIERLVQQVIQYIEQIQE